MQRLPHSQVPTHVLSGMVGCMSPEGGKVSIRVQAAPFDAEQVGDEEEAAVEETRGRYHDCVMPGCRRADSEHYRRLNSG